MPKGFIIAIDGPVASGKGVLAQRLAAELNGFHLYTGAMYRCIALMCIERGIDLNSEVAVEQVLPDLNIEFDGDRVLLDGKDVTDRIKKPDTASGASVIGVFQKVRKELVSKQQEIAEKAIGKGQIVVSEGRDTGTVVFPKAAFKMYLTAGDEIRARRRLRQANGQEDIDSLDKALKDLKERDKRDTERLISPLVSNPQEHGYYLLDNSEMTEEETLEVIITEIKKRKLI